MPCGYAPCGPHPGPIQSLHAESHQAQPRHRRAAGDHAPPARPDGCPWDRAQTFDTIAPYTIEEAYEVAAAIEDKDFKALPDELGDLLFQVVFHARMAEEARPVRFRRCGRGRHRQDDPPPSPCLWRRRRPRPTPHAQKDFWEELKDSERAARPARPALLDDVASALPALLRAEKLQTPRLKRRL